MSQLLESTASSDPTPPGTADPLPSDRTDVTPVKTADESIVAPADPIDELEKRQHPFGD